MFQKKQYIYSETQGVCRVENIVQLKHGKETQIPYYVLKPVYGSEHVSYIPVNNHKVRLRTLFSVEEAQAIAEDESLKENQNLQNAAAFVLKQTNRRKVRSNENAGKRTSDQ